MKTFLMALLMVLLAPSLVASQDCIDYGDYIHWVGGVDTPGEAWGVAVAGSHAYVADEYSGLQVVDVSDPESPSLVSNFPTMAATRQVAVADGFAYAALGDGYGYNGLEVIEVSDPAWLIHMGAVETPGVARDIVVDDDHVYAVYGEYGLRVIDVSEPTTPAVVGAWETGADATGVAVFGSNAYVTLSNGTWCVIDVSLPSSPTLVGSVSNIGSTRDVAFDGEWVYVARGGYGLQIAWPQCDEIVSVYDRDGVIPISPLSLTAYPNPFNPQTTISFLLERSERAKVGVYELTGRRVAVLADRTFTAGEHSLLWNGRDVTGRSMPSGTYLVRLETESRIESRKLMLIR